MYLEQPLESELTVDYIENDYPKWMGGDAS
jgi:hypothetical protein